MSLEACNDWMISNKEGSKENFGLEVLNHDRQVLIESDGSFHPDFQINTASWALDTDLALHRP